MKKNYLLLTLTLGFLYVSLSSKINGASLTGHATAEVGCDNGTGCHGQASRGIITSIKLIEKSSGTQVTNGEYKPGKLYTVEVFGRFGGAMGWGFMLRSSSGGGSTQAGTFSNPKPTETKLQALSPYTIFEHKQVIPDASGSFTATVDWMSPAAGTGNVTMHLSVNAVNNNGNSVGDEWGRTIETFVEAPVSVENIVARTKVTVYPNPATTTLNIDLPNATDYNYTIYGMTGNTLLSGSIANGNINVSQLTSGNYFINLSSGSETITTAFTKQ
ncbi:MAG: T9SS type A sorting domain-containing protein [Chitinophagales bacterium]|nr:T9SS type A sorting domain-containing protein [Chitinophagaceae bacterium]MCB9064713.1 T9SS type A sorting domain-containing protein [Chitinophagales bacterium]